MVEHGCMDASVHPIAASAGSHIHQNETWNDIFLVLVVLVDAHVQVSEFF
jgi:hypothetical protein